jgi:hypothetical protein
VLTRPGWPERFAFELFREGCIGRIASDVKAERRPLFRWHLREGVDVLLIDVGVEMLRKRFEVVQVRPVGPREVED